MFGGGSIQLGRILGIRIGASPSWFLVLFLMVYLLSDSFARELDTTTTTGYYVAVGGAAAFFVSLIVHELGHALAARRFGIGTVGIDLWFFGGFAKLQRDTNSAREEGIVAAAGPFATALTLGACVGVYVLAGGEDLVGAAQLDASDGDASAATALAAWAAGLNLILLIFNLIPAYPLDGGRIARALAWGATGDRHRATRASAIVGQGFALVLIALGIALLAGDDPTDGLLLAVLGWFMFQAARGAVLASRFAERVEGVTAQDLMDDDPLTIPAAETVLEVQDTFFLRYGYPWFMVVDADRRFLGVLTAERVDGAVTAGQPALPVAELLDPGEHDDLRIPGTTTLDALLLHEPLRRLGALAVVDDDQRLIGVLTVETVRRALAANAR